MDTFSWYHTGLTISEIL